MAIHRVAIVTGAAQGLGLATAKELLADGKKVAFTDVNRAQLKKVQEEVINSYFEYPVEEQVMFFKADVADNASIRECVDEVVKHWGRVDILVNNAGVRYTTPVEQIGLEEWNQVLSINLGGTFFFSQAVLEFMKNQKWGRIINMSSFGGQFGPLTSGAHYCASKAGQLALTKVFARALVADGITVNAVAPAAIQTPEMDKMSPEDLQKMAKGIPVGRFGRPEEVGKLICYLASEETSYITGATFDINGGMLMR